MSVINKDEMDRYETIDNILDTALNKYKNMDLKGLRDYENGRSTSDQGINMLYVDKDDHYVEPGEEKDIQKVDRDREQKLDRARFGVHRMDSDSNFDDNFSIDDSSDWGEEDEDEAVLPPGSDTRVKEEEDEDLGGEGGGDGGGDGGDGGLGESTTSPVDKIFDELDRINNDVKTIINKKR